jgi:hypothetical protein
MYSKEDIYEIVGQRIKILIKADEKSDMKYPKQLAGIITQVRNKTFVFRVFGNNRKHVYNYNQIASIAEPDYNFDLEKMK